MHYYESKIRIDALPETVWRALVDAEGYPEWDSGIDRVEGHIQADATITVHAHVNPGRAFPVTVSDFDENRCMTWTGGMPLGLFTGVRTFTLAAAESGGTDFVMREEYHGPMVPVIWRSMPDLQPSFDQFAAGLKATVESSVPVA